MTASRGTGRRGWRRSPSRVHPPRRAFRAVRILPAALIAGSLAVLLLIVAMPGPAAVAETPPERKRRLDRELSELRGDLEGTSSDLVDAVLELRRSSADLVDAQAGLAGATTALQAAQRRDAELAGKLALAQAAESKARRDLRQREAQERRTRTRLGQIAREAYLGSGLSGLSVALDAESPDQFAARVTVVGTALRSQNGQIERLDVQQAETRARRAKLTAARAEVAGLKRESAAMVETRRAAEQAAQAAKTKVQVVVTRQGQAVATISARKAAEEQRVRAMEREQSRLAALLARRSRSTGGGGGGSRGGGDGGSSLSYPVNAPVTSPFGRRYHPVLHYWRLHAGTDFGASCGTPVHAAAAGTVVRAGWAGGYGNQLVIDHGRMRGRNIATSANHLSRFVVRSGHVRRGQVVAYSGTTGLSTGCHLHFEVFSNGSVVNPMNWL
jgi:murein DD-endopeptidase MepM/ murein hydrolase activator NlpD